MVASRPTSYIRHPTSYIVPTLIAALFLWLFASVLFTDSTLAFRDAAHFYFPLFEYCRDEWGAGRVPLWNPYLGLGQPLLADGTSSVFYPGKLLFVLPLSYAPLYNAYILLHVLLAAWTAYRLARHWGASVEAAGVAALCYAFSGSVLFNVCNVVFLVGAAWLPLSLLAADKMLAQRSLAWAVALGIVLSLMVLGGDPQMAYHAGLLAVGLAVARRGDTETRGHGDAGNGKKGEGRGERGEGGGEKEDTETRRHGDTEKDGLRFHILHPTSYIRHFLSASPRLRVSVSLLAVAAITAILLAAIQVLPSYELAKRSTRAETRLADRFFARTPPGSQLEDAYHFSVGPWRIAEAVLPNVAGQQFPIHRRWLNALPGEGRVWTPTLYMGLLPLLLALSAMRFRVGWVERCETHAARDQQRGSRTARPTLRESFPCVFLTWVALLAVLASFGWFGIGWVLSECGVDTGPFGPPAGGLYWLLNLILPGYAQFRYPAKWLVVAALALSLLAARGHDRQRATPSRVLPWTLLGIAVACVFGLIECLLMRSIMLVWLSEVPADPVFGPLDTAGAWRDIAFAFGQSAVVAGIGAVLLSRPFASVTSAPQSGDAGKGTRRWAVPWQSWLLCLLIVCDLAVTNGWLITTVPVDVITEPPSIAEKVRADQADVLPAPPRISRYTPTFYWGGDGRLDTSVERLREVVEDDRRSLRPQYNMLERVGVVDTNGTFVLADFAKLYAAAEAAGQDEPLTTGPRAWLCSAADLHKTTPFAPLRDVPPERCWIVSYAPNEVVVEVSAAESCVLVLADQFYPGWRAERIDNDGKRTPLETFPVHTALRGVELPAGNCRVTFRYRPTLFYLGAAMSAAAWLGCLAYAIRHVIRSKP